MNRETNNVHKIVWAEHGSAFDGHRITAEFIYSGDKYNNVVIMAHGLGGNRYTINLLEKKLQLQQLKEWSII